MFRNFFTSRMKPERLRHGPDSQRVLIGKSKVCIGRFTYGANKISILQWGEGASLEIGAFCSVANDVTIFLGGNHRIDWITTYPFGHVFTNRISGSGVSGHPATRGNVVIGNDVWIADGVTILSGVRVGDGAVLGARAVVTKDVDPYTIVAGNPAQDVKKRFNAEIIRLLLELAWWNLPEAQISDIVPALSRAPDAVSLRNLISRCGSPRTRDMF
jgi:acetyltransferase-like isoleucine patch superfamily enzyme